VVGIFSEKLSVSAGEGIVIDVPLPGPGSVSKKYSAFVIFCEKTVVMAQTISNSMNNLLIPISFKNGKIIFSERY
jgi:hypothetical protein